MREGDGKETGRMGRVGERKGKREEGLELDICAGASSNATGRRVQLINQST